MTTHCWIEPHGGGRDKDGAPTVALKARALPFAELARDVYSYNQGEEPISGTPMKNWLELMSSPQEEAAAVNFTKIRVGIARVFGFNAMLYKLDAAHHAGVVLAFEGTHGHNVVKSPRHFVKFMQDMLLTNLPTVLSGINVLEPLGPFGVFGKLLNPTRAPSTQYEMAEILGRVVRDRYGPNVVLTGHSLGGGLASYAAVKTGLRAVAFNAAGVGFAPFTSLHAERIAHFKTTGDAVNWLVTDGTGPLSRHLGSEFAIGRGGHGMDDVIRLLRPVTVIAATHPHRRVG